MQCEPDEASSFTNPYVGPSTYAGFMAWTRQQGLVPYVGFKNVREDLSEDFYSVLHRVQTKYHLNILEAIVIEI